MADIIKKIFIVDDDEMMAEALSDYLTRKVQHSVLIFNTGEDCLLHLDKNPDVIVLDYFLNSMDKNAANGLQILEELRKKNNGQNYHAFQSGALWRNASEYSKRS